MVILETVWGLRFRSVAGFFVLTARHDCSEERNYMTSQNSEKVTDNFLANAIGVDRKRRKTSRIKFAVLATVLLVGLFFLAILPASRHFSKDDRKLTGADETITELGGKTEDINPSLPPQESTNPNDQTSSTKPKSQDSTDSGSYVPPAKTFNRSGFISEGQSVVSYYGDLLSRVDFGSSTSNSEKIQRIKDAVAREKQYKGYKLRAFIVEATPPNGEYASATDTAESAMASISVGLGGLNSWADGRVSANYDVSYGEVVRGANILKQFSTKLNSL